MARKYVDGWRMCVDKHELYFVTKFDCFAMPCLNQAFYAFAGATVFSSLYITMAYYQVFVKLADDANISLINYVGVDNMTTMPFNFSIALSTDKQRMAGVLKTFY